MNLKFFKEKMEEPLSKLLFYAIYDMELHAWHLSWTSNMFIYSYQTLKARTKLLEATRGMIR